jgi:CO dehydrogenase nickel-insertion accessory protein CooC1
MKEMQDIESRLAQADAFSTIIKNEFSDLQAQIDEKQLELDLAVYDSLDYQPEMTEAEWETRALQATMVNAEKLARFTEELIAARHS